MNVAFYLAASIAVLSTFLVITQTNGVHALLYLVVSLLAVALVFYTLGAVFAAALEVVVYAGAIVILLVFLVMMLNLGGAAAREAQWMKPQVWVGPAILAVILEAQLVSILVTGKAGSPSLVVILPGDVGIAMFGPYLLCVELASVLLLAALIGAYRLAHIGRGGG